MHILLALDRSDESFLAAKLLARIPFSGAPRVTVVTALMDARFELERSDLGIQLREQEKESAQELFQGAQGILEAAGMEVNHVMERGNPSHVILEHAKKNDVDLVALGARGHTAVYRAVLGSTADYVANHAKCSVLVVRPQQSAAADDAVDGSLNVMLAFDGAARSSMAHLQLTELEWPASTSVHIAMMLERPTMIPDDVVYDADVLADADKSLTAVCAASSAAYSLTHSVQETVHVGNAICSLADHRSCDLLFLGDTGKSAVKRMFLGSTSRYLLHHAKCSLWIARKKEWTN